MRNNRFIQHFYNNLSGHPSKAKSFRSLSSYLIGCYQGEQEGELKLTDDGDRINRELNNVLLENAIISNFNGDIGKTRTFFKLSEKYPVLTLSGLGKQEVEVDPNECMDEQRENIRIAAGSGVKALKEFKVNHIFVDPCQDASAAAEGSNLALYKYDELKSEKNEPIKLDLLQSSDLSDSKKSDWESGIILSACQNFARELTERPSNYKPPEVFAETVVRRFAKTDVKCIIRDEDWAKEMQMGAFLCVGQGSAKRSKFLELHYNGAGDEAPIVLIGKGVTFDSGGISIKPSKGMAEMRSDMGGAASVVAAVEAISQFKLSVNIVALIPLVENMPSGYAVKPGDVVKAMNGTTIEVDNTDAEGRLILADALCYAHTFNPSTIINLATLTGAIVVALGGTAAGTYVTCTELWKHFDKASRITGDRLWRMPLYKDYSKDMKWSTTADLKNIQKTSGSAGSPTAAAFLKEFVKIKSWAHLDIAGVASSSGSSYMTAGMSGRPTRTLVETIRRIVATE